MELWDTPKPKKGTLSYKLVEWFSNNINWCEGNWYGTDVAKPDNKVWDFLYTYWLFPFKQNECLCCNTTRGVFYGTIFGFILGKLL